jgi:2-polyprenyl-6-methoxyphenol hydroxylase-like FAD-dependent oxidoreductase
MMTQRPRRTHSGAHAVVIGGSMAGMLAARVLADHFDRITILERDRLSDQVAPRKGTPQARHLHVLLERGRRILEQLFPGLSQQLVAHGASLLDTAADFSILNPAGWAVQFRSGIPMLTCSRDLLDWHVRQRLQDDARFQFEQGADVARLVCNEQQTGVCGVAIRRRSAKASHTALPGQRIAAASWTGVSESEPTIYADLVVDASGRGSRMPCWLEALGYGRPDETVINAHVGYATRLYRRPTGLPAGRQGLFLQAAPPTHTRAGVAVPIEGNRWIVTVSGGDGNYPPTDDAGFIEFLRSLRSSAIYDAIKDCEPLSPIVAQRGLDNRVRHYERMARWPERLVVLGDAVCAFNPVYAQGITTAALGAMALDECLRSQRRWYPCSPVGVASRFQKKLAGVVRTPWLLATSEDRRYRKAESTRPSTFTRCSHRYMDQIFRLITSSTVVRTRSLEVFHLIRHPVTLFHPGNVVRVVAMAVKQFGRRFIRGLRGMTETVVHGQKAVVRSSVIGRQ